MWEAIKTFEKICSKCSKHFFIINRTFPFPQHCYPDNISRSDQRCFNVVDQHSNNVDPTLKMKQNLTSDFQRYTKLIQRRCPTLIQRRCPTFKQRWNKIDTTLSQRFFNVASSLVKAISKPVGLVISTDLHKFYSAKYFLQYTNNSTTEKLLHLYSNLLTVVPIGYNGKNGDSHKSSKFWNFKT